MSNIVVKPGTIPGFEGIDLMKAIRPIECQLVQKDENAGKFRFSTGETREELHEVVVLLIQTTRVLYGRVMGGEVRCASDNAQVPANRVQNPVSVSCQNCALAKWNDKMTKAELDFKTQMSLELSKPLKGRPLCRSEYRMLVVDQGSMVPYWLPFADGNMKIVNDQFVGGCGHRNLAPFQAHVTIKVQKRTAPGNMVWYEPYFQGLTMLADSSPYQELYHRYSQVAQRMMTEDFEAKQQAARTVGGDDEPPF
jgi:hypothetical protein